MSPEEQGAEIDSGRRRFLAAGVKGGVVVGTLAWAAPAVATAQTGIPVGSPPPDVDGGGPGNGDLQTSAPNPAPEVEPVEIPRSSPTPSEGPSLLPTGPEGGAAAPPPPGEVPRVLADGQRQAPSVGDVLATTGADIARLAALGAGATAAGASVVGLTRARSTGPADAVDAVEGAARSPDDTDGDEAG